MLVKMFLWTILMSFFLAKVEINIEGKNGWAKDLPTWRFRNIFTHFFFGDIDLTGYHFWMFSMLFLFFHFPFVFGIPWNMPTELQVLSMFVFFLIIEDFLWFILNPAYGLKKFNKEHVMWHKKWIGRLPMAYVKGYTFATALLFASVLFF